MCVPVTPLFCTVHLSTRVLASLPTLYPRRLLQLTYLVPSHLSHHITTLHPTCAHPFTSNHWCRWLDPPHFSSHSRVTKLHHIMFIKVLSLPLRLRVWISVVIADLLQSPSYSFVFGCRQPLLCTKNTTSPSTLKGFSLFFHFIIMVIRCSILYLTFTTIMTSSKGALI